MSKFVEITLDCDLRRLRAEIKLEPDGFIRWKYAALVAESHDAICNFLSIPPKNTVFVDSDTVGTLLYSHIGNSVCYSLLIHY